MGQAVVSNGASWIAPFEQKLKDMKVTAFSLALGNILKECLLSDDVPIMIKTACRIEDFYEKEFMQMKPERERQDEKGNDTGMEDFLFAFYDVFFTLARFIPYNTSAQQKLLLLLLQLRKQPAKAVKLLDKQCVVWSRDPVLMWNMDGHWDFNRPRTEEVTQEDCDEWLSFATFFARCVEADIVFEYEYRWENCCMDIEEALEKDAPHGAKRDCFLMTAAQYILLAGRTLTVDCYRDPYVEKPTGWCSVSRVEGPVRWKGWADRFKEISREESGNPRIASVTKQAREYMVSLRPELFGDDDDVAI